MTGIFSFTTTVDYSTLYFYNISQGSTIYHRQTDTMVPLREGINLFEYAGDYLIVGTFEKIHALFGDEYIAYTPFREGVVTRWENTGTTDASTLFAFSDLRGIVEPPATVSNMDALFQNAQHIPDISGWNVSNVTTMRSMFQETRQFNQNINSWDVSNVTHMDSMFHATKRFNQPLGSWDVSRVQSMQSMFERAYSFDQDIGFWNVGQVKNMASMFRTATSYNNAGNSLDWDTANAVSMRYMFSEAFVFNQDISAWDVSNVQDMHCMLYFAENYDNIGHVLDYWDVSSLQHPTMNIW